MFQDFGESRIKELEKEIIEFKRHAESLINIAFSNPKLRNNWRLKFKMSEFEIISDNGDME